LLVEGRGDLRSSRLERFIGVIYRPTTELQSHYTEASLALRAARASNNGTTMAATNE
jgi:hypothetical protein